jgi:glucose-6-phosphate dehydrogenase assembly protein OpcA
VIDSATLGQDRAALQALAKHVPCIVDFNWLRLLPWAELVAQFFDPEPSRRYLEQLTMLQIEYVSPSPFGAVLLTAWLADRLRWVPFSEDRAPLVRFFRASGEPGQYAMAQLFPEASPDLPGGSLLGMVAAAERRAGASARFQIRRGPSGASVQTLARLPNSRQIARTAPLPPEDTPSLLAEALDQTEPSLIYQDALRLAVRLST